MNLRFYLHLPVRKGMQLGLGGVVMAWMRGCVKGLAQATQPFRCISIYPTIFAFFTSAKSLWLLLVGASFGIVRLLLLLLRPVRNFPCSASCVWSKFENVDSTAVHGRRTLFSSVLTMPWYGCNKSSTTSSFCFECRALEWRFKEQPLGVLSFIVVHFFPDIDGWGLSPRGAGYLFGGDVVSQV